MWQKGVRADPKWMKMDRKSIEIDEDLLFPQPSHGPGLIGAKGGH